jgi:hypothetical protein
MLYQYIRPEYTLVRLTVNSEKQKVRYGEIVESSRDPMYFLENGFRTVVKTEKSEEKKDSITVAVKRGRKSKK